MILNIGMKNHVTTTTLHKEKKNPINSRKIKSMKSLDLHMVVIRISVQGLELWLEVSRGLGTRVGKR